MSETTDDNGDDFVPPADFDTWTTDQRDSWAFDGSLLRFVQKQRQAFYAAWEHEHSAQVVSERAADRDNGAPFRILTRSDLRRMPRVSWLIDGLVQTSGLVVLAGDGGIGKSAVAIDWACSVASCKPDWHGRKVHGRCAADGGSVLYVAGEGVEGFEARLCAWEAMTGIAIPEDALHFVADGFSLSNERAATFMELEVRQRDYSLVVLDTLSQLSALENENDNAELSRVLNVARGIRQARPGCTVLIVHHVSKGGRVRGASTIRNNADAVIVARPDQGANVSTFSLSTEHEHDGKQKNGRAETISGFWLDEVAGSVVVRRGGQDVIAQAIDGVLQDGLEHSGPEFFVACAATDDATRKTVKRRLDKLVADGLVTVSGTTRARRWQLVTRT